MTTSWLTPGYADTSRFDEHGITLDDSVDGTLTLPHEPTGTGAVLRAGGGPFDRDQTIGPNKPLKDLAWGLASRGITVLRFDKVTFTRPTAPSEPDFTMTREYLPHATAAVALLREHVERVVLVGHSMGGKIAPRVAAATPVDGLVVMAGDTQPMHHAAVRVAAHLARILPEAVTPATVDRFREQAALIDSDRLTASTPADELPFSMSGAYWLDLRDYDPVATAAALNVPMLILQGGRDYQVTVADDLAGWRRGLSHRDDVTIQVLDADDHLFFPGTGESSPADYAHPQHVDPGAIGAITTWLSPA